MKGLQPKGIARRNKMLLAAIQLFLEQGYEKTTTAQISRAAGMSPTSFFAAFENKEALLLKLTQIMFENQFEKARSFAENHEPLMVYCLETALQINITELSESLREIYVMAYTLPSTSEYIYRSTAIQIKNIFAAYMPDAEDKDFYEMDIASGSITRGFMAKPCDMYFTLDRKLRRYLDCCLKLYNVPTEKRNSLIEAVLAVDLNSVAAKLIEEIVAKAETGLEEAIGNKIT
ncbi:TetR/AcrR family transcriptional regulator [Bovifimicola ammoniilytica]|uniref:TetR/AcrR family transcriptional regulator n=1 Tax=Bovifimicola ammoniilytica TaxID=2981720 RepID=UPI000821CE80|nr:TetR/AcrR family transcriptional regulator [Bovifimicola ammoniilytica]MCU6753022.1 TetR/AcrR family transcriptional regulator [Bovifimicola ammoniilytica]SCJ48196.1 mycofactocin system transcriptional regulator [uncultured Eubacterium sp.]